MKLKAALLASVLALTTVPALTSWPMAQTAMPDPLDDRSVKRLDKMEKVVRELRAIVFQGRDTGKPVVVQAAETDAQIAALSEKLTRPGTDPDQAERPERDPDPRPGRGAPGQ
jgi:TolA-binding protein